MKHNITYQELNDEQLEKVVGGSWHPHHYSKSYQNNSNTTSQSNSVGKVIAPNGTVTISQSNSNSTTQSNQSGQ